MIERIETTYKGFYIIYSEDSNTWRCEVSDNMWHEKESLKDIKAKINELLRKESRFKELDAYRINHWGEKTLEMVTITSISEDGKYFWVRRSNKREKVNAEDICTICEHNVQSMRRMTEISQEQSRLREERDQLERFLIRIKTK